MGLTVPSSLSSKIRTIKSRRLSWAGHVARMGGRTGMQIGFWWESLKERDHYEQLDASGRIILKWILEKQNGMLKGKVVPVVN
jgi:hypothetical protein